MELQQLTIKEIDCSQQYVSEAVGDSYRSWNHFSPVFIEAPTGSGKNTFILTELANYARKQNQFVLLISNRTVLSQQQKRRLHKKYYSWPISDDDLQKEHCFDNIFLYSYQEILSHLPILSKYDIGYVIFDEAHFFLSDARFNADTDIILYSLLNTFSRAVRIYMTATANQVLPCIYNAEATTLSDSLLTFVGSLSLLRLGTPPLLIHYRLHPTFSNVGFRFFNTWETIVDLIAKTSPSEKWLIFVQREDEKDELQKLFTSKIKVKYINAANKYNNESYDEIVRLERFDAQVLISTIVLDNGLNLYDPALKHIVIHSYDPISTVQAAGRKRRDGSNTLYYIKNITLKEIEQFARKTNQFIDICDSFQKDPNHFIKNHWGQLPEDMQKLFRINPCNSTMTINQFAIAKLHFDKAVLEDLYFSIKSDPDTGFQNQVFSWFQYSEPFNRETMQIEDTTTYRETILTEIEEQIKSYIGQGHKLTLDDCFGFQNQLATAYQKVLSKKMPTANDSSRIVKNIQTGLSALGIAYTFEKIKRKDLEDPTKFPRWRFLKK